MMPCLVVPSDRCLLEFDYGEEVCRNRAGLCSELPP